LKQRLKWYYFMTGKRDVRPTSKGMLVPLMTMAQRDQIANPATGN
jgi:hypothetical protein